MIVKLLTERHLEFLSLKGGCRGSSESTHVKMPHCWNHMSRLICFSGFVIRSCSNQTVQLQKLARVFYHIMSHLGVI